MNDLPSSIGLGMEWGEGMIERNAWVRTEGGKHGCWRFLGMVDRVIKADVLEG